MPLQFDPRDLVHAPFEACPHCGAAEFGVYSVNGHSYERRCRQCWHRGTYYLWPLSKKIIYIDQFAISNMMKTLNRKHPRHEAARQDPFWLTLFERLSRLRDLQLAIFPHSDIHRNESLVSDAFDAMKTMYEHLSYNIGFMSVDTIALRQLNVALGAWLEGERPQYDFDPERVTHGRLNEWPDSVFVTVGMDYPQSRIDSIRTFRDEVHRKIADFYEEDLRTSHETSFEYWIERERRISSRTIIDATDLYAKRIAEMIAKRIPPSLDNLYSSKAWHQYRLIADVMSGSGVPDEEFEGKLTAFLDSDEHKDYPVNRISSLVWAAIDRAAALGQGVPPNEGTSNDIAMLCLQPYCDAMFVDNGCRALWEKVPQRYRPPYAKARLFSPNIRAEFLKYLEDVEAQGDDVIIRSALQLYGEPRLYLTMYDERRNRGADE
jgi:hypothetical protein